MRIKFKKNTVFTQIIVPIKLLDSHRSTYREDFLALDLVGVFLALLACFFGTFALTGTLDDLLTALALISFAATIAREELLVDLGDTFFSALLAFRGLVT